MHQHLLRKSTKFFGYWFCELWCVIIIWRFKCVAIIVNKMCGETWELCAHVKRTFGNTRRTQNVASMIPTKSVNVFVFLLEWKNNKYWQSAFPSNSFTSAHDVILLFNLNNSYEYFRRSQLNTQVSIWTDLVSTKPFTIEQISNMIKTTRNAVYHHDYWFGQVHRRS